MNNRSLGKRLSKPYRRRRVMHVPNNRSLGKRLSKPYRRRRVMHVRIKTD